MIGMSTGFTLRSMKDLYCNNSIIKTGTMIAGVMLASCANNDNNDKRDEKNKICFSDLTDKAKRTFAEQLEVESTKLQYEVNRLKLDENDINEDGTLTARGVRKKGNADHGKIKENCMFLSASLPAVSKSVIVTNNRYTLNKDNTNETLTTSVEQKEINDKVRANAEAKITEVLKESIKTDDKIDVLVLSS